MVQANKSSGALPTSAFPPSICPSSTRRGHPTGQAQPDNGYLATLGEKASLQLTSEAAHTHFWGVPQNLDHRASTC
jgi:hypothetical protein